MAALTQTQMQSLPDVLASDRFVLNFGNVPGYGDSYNVLSFKAMDVAIPGIQNEHFGVPIGPTYRSFSGRRNYIRTMACTFTETVDLSTLKCLRAWLENVRNTDSGNSNGYINSYAIVPTISVYDTAGNIADSIQLYRCFIIDLADHNMSTQGAQAVQVQAQFSYDYPIYASTAPQ